MKYAIIQAVGKQYKVEEGSVLDFDFMEELKSKDAYSFTDVLLVVDSEKRLVGFPKVENASVTGTVLDQVKGKKIRVAKFKAKVRYRRVKGFRPLFTKIKIDKIIIK